MRRKPARGRLFLSYNWELTGNYEKVYAGGMKHRKTAPANQSLPRAFVLRYDADTDAFTVHAVYRRRTKTGSARLAWETKYVGRDRWLWLVSCFPANLRRQAVSVTRRAIAEPGEAWGIPIGSEVARG
jgi:hypothetical protein